MEHHNHKNGCKQEIDAELEDLFYEMSIVKCEHWT